MPDYRRSKIHGGTYFFTVVTYQRKPIFADTNAIDAFKHVVKTVLAERSVKIDAWVLLPDHMHFVWTLPENDNDYSTRIGMMKSRFTKSLSGEQRNKKGLTASRRKKRESTIWQRRFWEHQIRDEHDHRKHIDYVHVNPMKHGYVKRVIDWPHSTFHRYANNGIYTPDWCGDVDAEISIHGE